MACWAWGSSLSAIALATGLYGWQGGASNALKPASASDANGTTPWVRAHASPPSSSSQMTSGVFVADAATIRAAQAMLTTPLYQGVPDPNGPGLDGSGHLVINKALRDFFDHYLLGDDSPQHGAARYLVTQQALKQWAHAQAGEHERALGELDDLFTRYVAMLTHLQNHAPAMSNNSERLASLHQTRVQFLGEPVTQALYGQEEWADRAALQSRDSGIMPTVGDTMQRETARFDAAGLSVEARYAARVKAHGQTVAERWLLLDRQAHERKLALQTCASRWQGAGKPGRGGATLTPAEADAQAALLAPLPAEDRDLAQALMSSDGFDAYLATLP